MQNTAHVLAYAKHISHNKHCVDRSCYEAFYFCPPGSTHPAVRQALKVHGMPAMPLLMAHQAPTVAEDGVRVAYFQTPEKAARELRTVTTVGKYIKRFWPDLCDHLIRDIASLFGPDEITVLDTTEAIVAAIQDGPESCMQWLESDDSPKRYAHREGHAYRAVHPYQAYCPKLGWRLVVRKQGTKIVGRALTYDKVFVRSYAQAAGDSYSETDHKIDAYLFDLGYDKEDAWPEGTRLLKVPFKHDYDFIVPFLDPGSANIADDGRNLREDGDYLVRDDDGEIDADCIDGSFSENSNSNERFTCEDCGEREHVDDSYSVGRHEDCMVCSSCAENYTNVYGRNGHQYMIPENDAVQVGTRYYDPDYLGDNDIVILEDGEYCDQDDAVYVESQSEYYHESNVGHKKNTSCAVVYTGECEYEMRDDCQWCEVNKGFYTEDTMTELNDYWVLDKDLAEHLGEMSLDELEENHPDWEEYFPTWEAYQNRHNPAQVVLELEGV